MMQNLMAVLRVFSTVGPVLCIKFHTELQQLNKINELSFFIFPLPQLPETVPSMSKFVGGRAEMLVSEVVWDQMEGR